MAKVIQLPSRTEPKHSALQIYNAGYYNALKEFRDMLIESQRKSEWPLSDPEHPIDALIGSIGRRLARMIEENDISKELIL